MLVHAVRTPEERDVHTLLLGRLRDRGARLRTIAWDRGMAFLDLESFGPVHEIEAINRWRLPQHLARIGLRPLARQLRQRRVRRWWAGSAPDAVVVLGRVRDEMRHYVPPGSGPVTALVGWRPAEGAESSATTAELADHVLAADEAAAAEAREAGADVATFAEVVTGLAPTEGPDGGEVLVCGIGPGDWRGAPELFLRVGAALPAEVGGRRVCLGWIGLDPTDGRSFPYLYDAEHLGLADRLAWWHQPTEALAALSRSAVVVVTGRSPFALPVHPLVDAVGPVPFLRAVGPAVVGFDTPALDPLRALQPDAVAYPDVGALAERVRALLSTPARPDPNTVVDAVVDRLLAEAQR